MDLTYFIESEKKEGLDENQSLEVDRAIYTQKNFNELGKVIKKCKKIIEAEEGIRSDISFKEITKIILTKMYEEKRGMAGESNRFCRKFLIKSNNPIKEFQNLFNDAKNAYAIYDESKESIKPLVKHDENLLNIVDLLENWSFLGIDEDIKGMLYEVFLKASLRGDLGQFFTPKELVNSMIDLVNPQLNNRILDPACGSGGFLIHSFLKIKKEVEQKDKDKIKKFIDSSLWGFEVDSDLHLLAKINLIMHGDGYSNIHNANFISYKDDDIKSTFDVILTNPPFSFPVESKEHLKMFELGKDRTSEQIDILYVEKCLRLLKDDGVLSIVLPEGLLNLPTYRYFRDFILDKADLVGNISIPAGAFIPFGQSNSKTCVLILKKKGKQKIEYSFIADAVEIGFEVGKKEYKRHNRNDLIDFVNHYKSNNRTVKTSEWGGRSAFVKKSMIDPERLDAKYYFMKLYLEEIKKSGANVKKLSEIATITQKRINPSKTPDKEFYYLEVPDISEDTGMIGNIRKIKGKYINGNKVHFKSGDVLFTRLYPDKNRIIIVPEEIKEGVCSDEIYLIRPKDAKEVNPYVLLAALKSSMVTNQVKDLISGSSSSRPRLKDKDLHGVLIPVLTTKQNDEIASKMKKIVDEHWNACQGYLYGYKDILSNFGDDIIKDLIRKV
jgi:type I restriction enzyme M protein